MSDGTCLRGEAVATSDQLQPYFVHYLVQWINGFIIRMRPKHASDLIMYLIAVYIATKMCETEEKQVPTLNLSPC